MARGGAHPPLANKTKPMLFSEAAPDANAMLQLFLAANLILSVAIGIKTFFPAKREIGGQPIEVKGAVDWARRDVVDKHMESNHREHENIFKKIGGMERGIYEEINKLREGQAKNNSNDQHQNQHLVHIESKLDRLIERNNKRDNEA